MQLTLFILSNFDQKCLEENKFLKNIFFLIQSKYTYCFLINEKIYDEEQRYWN